MVLVGKRNTRGISKIETLSRGIGKDGKPVGPNLGHVEVEDLFDLQFDHDAHVVAYDVVEPDGTLLDPAPRQRKESLAQVRALGGDVRCSVILVDVDLKHMKMFEGRGDISWTTMSEDETIEVIKLRSRAEENLFAKDMAWTYYYSTEHGLRFVHVLTEAVPCGSNYERLLSRVHDAYHAAGLPADRSCCDWTRLYRAPMVTKESGLKTWEQPWFDWADYSDEDRYLVPDADCLQAEDDPRKHEAATVFQADQPDADEARSLIWINETDRKMTPEAEKVEELMRGSEVHGYIFAYKPIPFSTTGERHTKLTKLVGLVVKIVRRAKGSVELAYALVLRATSVLEQDEDWGAKAWEMTTAFWGRDGGDPPPDQTPTVVSPTGETTSAPVSAPEKESDPLDPLDPEDNLDVNPDSGRPYKKPRNVRVGLRILGAQVEYDEFSCREVLVAKRWRGHGPGVEDPMVRDLRIAFEEELKFPVEKDWFFDCLGNMASRNRRHPVREYLDTLSWDGESRIHEWMVRYLGAIGSSYSSAVGRIFLVAAVRRVRHPGCKFDEMLLLEGAQGGLKSSALRTLAVRDEWFSDDLRVGASAKEIMEQTQGKWILEASDLQGMANHGVEELKAFLSRTTDHARLSYDRKTSERPRQFVIAGTTNSDNYLKDSTGNRRFWPVAVPAIDLDALRRDRDQLWAEACLVEAEGEPVRLHPSLYPDAEIQQESRKVEDPHVESLREVLGDVEGRILSSDVWEILGISTDRRTQEGNARMGSAMRVLGWSRDKFWADGKVRWGYVRGQSTARLKAKRTSDRTVKIVPAPDEKVARDLSKVGKKEV